MMDDAKLNAMLCDILLFKTTSREVAQKYGVSTATVSRFRRVYAFVEKEEWDELKKLAKQENGVRGFMSWSAERLGKAIPADFWPVKEAVKEEPPAEEQKTEAPRQAAADGQNTALVISSLLSMIEKQNLLLSQMAKESREQTELMTQLLDTVLPHWVTDLKECINTNADLVCTQLDESKKLLDAVKCNTRRRGT